MGGAHSHLYTCIFTTSHSYDASRHQTVVAYISFSGARSVVTYCVTFLRLVTITSLKSSRNSSQP